VEISWWGHKMQKNMGTLDQIIRFVIAIIILALYITSVLQGVLAIILGIIAIILVLTSITGFCPLYLLLKISTIKKN
jgi:hypothetical protein